MASVAGELCFAGDFCSGIVRRDQWPYYHNLKNVNDELVTDFVGCLSHWVNSTALDSKEISRGQVKKEIGGN